MKTYLKQNSKTIKNFKLPFVLLLWMLISIAAVPAFAYQNITPETTSENIQNQINQINSNQTNITSAFTVNTKTKKHPIFNRLLEFGGDEVNMSKRWEIEDGFFHSVPQTEEEYVTADIDIADAVTQTSVSEISGTTDLKTANQVKEKKTVQIRMKSGDALKYKLNNILDNRKTVLKYKIRKEAADISAYKQLTFILKSSEENPDVSLKVRLLEETGEIWIEKASHIPQNAYSEYLINLESENFILDKSGPKENEKLDLTKISQIQIVIESENKSRKEQNIYLDEMTLQLKPKTINIAAKKEKPKEEKPKFSTASFKTKAASQDQTPPQIEYMKIDNKIALNGDLMRKNPVIEIKFTENNALDSGIVSWNVSIVNLDNSAKNQILTETIANPVSGSVTKKPELIEELVSGRYRIQASAEDGNNNTTSNIAVEVEVKADFEITNVIPFPNPFDPNKTTSKIEYQLSDSADEIRLYIYSISGKELQQRKLSYPEAGTEAGYNKLEWDGRNSYGEIVANGVYAAYIVAKKSGKQRVGKAKIAVLK